MIQLLRIVLSAALFLASWTLVIGSIGLFGHWARYEFVRWILPIWNDGVTTTGELLPRYASFLDFLRVNLSWEHAVPVLFEQSLQASCVLLLALTLWILFRPLERDVRDGVGSLDYRELGRDHPLYMAFDDLRRQAGVHRVRLFVGAIPGVNAFALAKPLGSGIVISPAVAEAPMRHALWILAHELGHIRHLDTFPQALWIATNRLAAWMVRARWMVFRSALPALQVIPFVRLFVFPFEVLFLVLHYTTRVALAMARSLFLVTDRFLVRRTEFAADAFASRLAGQDAGVEVLTAFQGLPKLGLLATHPAAEDRIRRLERC